MCNRVTNSSDMGIFSKWALQETEERYSYLFSLYCSQAMRVEAYTKQIVFSSIVYIFPFFIRPTTVMYCFIRPTTGFNAHSTGLQLPP